MSKKITVGVIFGGRSGEHEVSLVSATYVIEALDRTRYEIVPIGITKEGQWIVSGDPLRILKDGAASQVTERAFLSPDPHFHGIIVLGKDKCLERVIPIDVVFPVLHGPCGEDGTIQGLFELAGIPYVGAGVLASSCGMDKIIMKELFRAGGLPVTESAHFTRSEWSGDRIKVIESVERVLDYPLFIKPANLGSSVGITKAHTREELAKGIDEACSFDRKVLVEKAVKCAREIECSVLGNEEPETSVPGEIIPCNEFYDYEAKYVAGKSDTIAPADLPAELAGHIREMAIRAYKALSCEGMARVDFLLERESDELFVNELNTIPGFTSISMYPKLWQASGLGYRELLDRLIELAIKRHNEKEKTRTGITLENEWYKKETNNV